MTQPEILIAAYATVGAAYVALALLHERAALIRRARTMPGGSPVVVIGIVLTVAIALPIWPLFVVGDAMSRRSE